LLFWKIIKIVATRCQILWLKCTKFDFGWGSAPDPAGGAYSAPQNPLAGFKGAYFPANLFTVDQTGWLHLTGIVPFFSHPV